ncbi:MAG: NUDIX domain-containing protein [Verrucomicrobia bacterium]|nr:NUDIX domain-containing protein [Verrucomicrobiota bacterium]
MKKPFKLAVKAVILDGEDRCLLIRRSQHCRHFTGQWEWPGGKPDPGEDFTTALVREVREETSLEVDITGLAGATTFEMSALHVVLLCMEARVIAGEVHLSEEHDDFAWVGLEDVAQREILEPMKPVLKNLLERKDLP